MKPFDLEAAKAGAPVVTRDGKKARIICSDLNNGEYDLIALVAHYSGREEIVSTKKDGRRLPNSERSTYDLFMASVKKEGWLNIYPKNCSSDIHPTRELADLSAQQSRVACVKVEWEE